MHPQEPRRAAVGHHAAAALVLSLLVLGSLGPWVTSGRVGGAEGIGGLSLDGLPTLATALLALVAVVVALLRRRPPPALLLILLGAFALFLGLLDVAMVRGDAGSVAWGLWLTVVSGALLVVLGVVLRARPRR